MTPGDRFILCSDGVVEGASFDQLKGLGAIELRPASRSRRHCRGGPRRGIPGQYHLPGRFRRMMRFGNASASPVTPPYRRFVRHPILDPNDLLRVQKETTRGKIANAG